MTFSSPKAMIFILYIIILTTSDVCVASSSILHPQNRYVSIHHPSVVTLSTKKNSLRRTFFTEDNYDTRLINKDRLRKIVNLSDTMFNGRHFNLRRLERYHISSCNRRSIVNNHNIGRIAPSSILNLRCGGLHDNISDNITTSLTTSTNSTFDNKINDERASTIYKTSSSVLKSIQNKPHVIWKTLSTAFQMNLDAKDELLMTSDASDIPPNLSRVGKNLNTTSNYLLTTQGGGPAAIDGNVNRTTNNPKNESTVQTSVAISNIGNETKSHELDENKMLYKQNLVNANSTNVNDNDHYTKTKGTISKEKEAFLQSGEGKKSNQKYANMVIDEVSTASSRLILDDDYEQNSSSDNDAMISIKRQYFEADDDVDEYEIDEYEDEEISEYYDVDEEDFDEDDFQKEQHKMDVYDRNVTLPIKDQVSVLSNHTKYDKNIDISNNTKTYIGDHAKNKFEDRKYEVKHERGKLNDETLVNTTKMDINTSIEGVNITNQGTDRKKSINAIDETPHIKESSTEVYRVDKTTDSKDKQQAQLYYTKNLNNTTSSELKYTDQQKPSLDSSSNYISSGMWSTIDNIVSFGFATDNENIRISRKLHSVRKKLAHATGLHGLVSGKGRITSSSSILGKNQSDVVEEINEEDLGVIRRRLAAIELARKRVAEKAQKEPYSVSVQSKELPPLESLPRWRRPFARIARRQQQNQRNGNFTNITNLIQNDIQNNITETKTVYPVQKTYQLSEDEIKERELLRAQALEEELRRRERVKEIDRLIQEGSQRIAELHCEKDYLQRRPNPLYNYTSTASEKSTSNGKNPNSDEKKSATNDEATGTSRIFNFPPADLVAEYIDELVANGRLRKLNHTQLWRSRNDDWDDDEESIGDDLLTPSADARKLYENNGDNDFKQGRFNSGGGSWLLRQNVMGGSLGEKIGDIAETAAYKGVCSSVMSILAKSIAALHGVNIMAYSDIRLFVESAADLPPVSKSVFRENDYAQEVIDKAIRKGSAGKKRKRKQHHETYMYGNPMGDDVFLQRDAVVETLISHCQISMPLLKLFPLAWQRAMLGNIVTLIAAVVSDFCEGIQLQILGHNLSFSFKPITEADMIDHIGANSFRFNHRRSKPEEFEAAVKATANDISDKLAFLDRWHQKMLGGDVLRAQIGNLIARVVLTLVDEVLVSARMDLWSAQVGGPRMVAGLEYRTDERMLKARDGIVDV